MNTEEIKKAIMSCAGIDSLCDECPYNSVNDCDIALRIDARNLITEQEQEIEKLKNENVRLTAKLGQVLLSIDTVKEMNTMCNIAAQVNQAKIDAFNKLKEKIVERMGDREYMGVKYKQGVFSESEIDEMIAEVQNAED